MSPRWIGVDGVAELRDAACERILESAARAIDARGRFVIALAGGTTPRDVYAKLRTVDADWPRWHAYFGDERCVPRDDAGRNNRMAGDAWLDHVAIPRGQVHVIPAELGPAAAAFAYANTLRAIGEFDLVLLGLGEDGHTASLFPGQDWGAAPGSPSVLAVTNAPKPPPQRVSLSAARLSRSRQVLFMVAGESKREAFERWQERGDIPASAIRPAAGVDVLVEAALLRAPVS
jgi:6-phosphogluconolactonase